MLEGQPIEIFRAGDYGAKGRFTTGDLDQVVNNFNPMDGAPVVVGHPKEDSPAWGWVNKLWRSGNSLMATVRDIHPKFAHALAEKRFKNRSVKLFKAPDGKWKLAHLGFLGAALPGVEGMEPLKLSAEGEEIEIEWDFAQCEFSAVSLESTHQSQKHQSQEKGTMAQEDQPGVTPQERDQLQKQIDALQSALETAEADRTHAEDAARRSGFSAWADAQAQAGRISRSQVEEVTAFMMTLPHAGDTSRFTAGGTKTSPAAWFKGFVEARQVPDFAAPLPDSPDGEAAAEVNFSAFDMIGAF